MTQSENKYFDRELSWLSFNLRVLEETKDESLPLYERLKFLAIYSSNLDEFYRIRVASYRGLLKLSQENKKNLEFDPEEVLSNINDEVSKQQVEYARVFEEIIIPELAENGIVLYQNEELDDTHKKFISNFFFREILPYIQPVLLVKDAVLSFLQDNVIYLAVKMYKKSKKKYLPKRKRLAYSIIKLPTNHLPRFIELPPIKGKYLIMFIEDIIRKNLDKIFPGYIVISSYCIKLSRDAELSIEDEFSGNIIEKVKKSLSRRKIGAPARFLYDPDMPNDFLKLLKQIFKLSKTELVPGTRYIGFNDFFKFPNPMSPKLESKPLPPLQHRILSKYNSILQAIKENDVLLHFPYQSYDYVLRFLKEAAVDPKVEEIKITQYRVASNSAVVNALINAAMNGKKVTVFVEVKARFDEETNLRFAEQMQKAGINVIPPIPGLKVHAKAALVIRKSQSKPNKQRGYAFLSTGNFNEKTAQIYADHALFTSNDELVDELKNLFLFLENPHKQFKFNHLLVPKFNFNEEFIKKIDREIANVKKGKKGYIIIKINGIEDIDIINKLYEASANGVIIDLIARGVCCVVPEKPFSKNITITRIVDQYLEHARVFVFHNNGKNEVYISSADLMKRNLHRRVESIVPIYNEELKNEIIDILNIQLQDNTKARIINSKLENIEKDSDGKHRVRSQIDTYIYLKNKLSPTAFDY